MCRLFDTSQPYPNPTGKILLSPHDRGSNTLRKLSNSLLDTESENTHVGLSYIYASFPLQQQMIPQWAPTLNNESLC